MIHILRRGLYFYSALCSFATRTTLANMDNDHLVGFSNASLRSLDQLPPALPAAARAKGVVLEDALSAAFWPSAWQELQRKWAAAAAAAPAGTGSSSSSEGRAASAAAIIQQPYAASRIYSSRSNNNSWHEINGNGGGSGLAAAAAAAAQQQQPGCAAAAAGLEAAGAPGAATAAVAGVVAHQQQQVAPGDSADNSADELVQLTSPGQPAAPGEQQQPGMLSTAGAAAAAAAAERDLTSGLSSGGAAVAVSAAAAAADVAADASSSGRALGSRVEVVARTLQRLQELPWRRIDVSFQGARFGLAHNNLQVTRRWWNFEGAAVPAHLAEQLRVMDEVVRGPQAQ
jgi:hypothetical protein